MVGDLKVLIGLELMYLFYFGKLPLFHYNSSLAFKIE